MGTSRSRIWRAGLRRRGPDRQATRPQRLDHRICTHLVASHGSEVPNERPRSTVNHKTRLDRSLMHASQNAHDLISAEHDSWSSARTAWIEVARILPQVSRKLPTPQVQNGRPGSTGDTVSISATHDFRGPRRTAVIDRQRSASRPSEGQESQSRPPDGSHASSRQILFLLSVSLFLDSPSQLRPIQSRVSFGGREIPFRSWKARLPRPLVFPTLV